ncbi:CDP-2,3-bis-(O-geranylgeranyl)-sn-glycerol synthase [Candidatus Peregrinibacteria bacterium]|jgi:CDP-2,3-bis-(O-geranylgeranyl)-sn-glycerol synthase|nr:CDP-2,3-bis-(O-geranylgeranyl)-sn-glycerol synthase [Candidatus Peregrinibacteria bacterium]MBT4055943.1 CDP-2,3-bis-(O-geranylgeranyl)-sn-glycerol synthase [Candidatus Peregrinibacteria bacterium]
MIDLLLQVIWFMLPAYVANLLPPLFSHVKMGRVLDGPVDLGHKAFGKRIFGDHKTVKGFMVGTTGGILTAIVQHSLIGDYSFYFSFTLGFLLGFGALFGDSIESFLKRQLGVRSGGALPVFDQIDFPVGALLLSSIVVDLDLGFMAVIVVVSGLLSTLANLIAYALKIKKVWW